MLKRIIYLSILFFAMQNTIAQNVGINTTGTAPDNSAMLDIDATNRGVLIPRIALSATNVTTPITSPATSLMVYNTATAGTAPNNVTPGYYYWNGTVWVRVATDGDYWRTNGNSNTTASSSGIGVAANNNFIGTTDAIDFAIATNGLERFRIKSDNNTQIRIGVGTTFTVNLNASSTPSLFHLHDWGTTANDFAQLNLSSATTTNGNRVGVLNFAATTVTNERRTASIESHITNYTAPNATGDLRFFTNNANTYSEKMRIQGDGNVGINTTQPIYKTDIRSSTNKGTTAALEYLFHIGSANTTDPLGIRIGIRTLASPIANRYAAIEVDDAGNKRALSLQPNGGNVGIGITLPSFKLEILDTISDKHLGLHRNSVTNGDAAGIYFRVHTTGPDNYKGAILFERTATNGRGSMHFVTSDISTTANVALADAKMTITREGYVGIGTTNPLAPFDVRKNINYAAGDGTNQDGPTTAIIAASTSSRQNDWPVAWGGGLSTWDICGASTFMTGYATRSDERFKNNIKNLTSSLNTVMKLRPVSYFMDIKYESDNKEHLHFGFIAQEVETFFPNIVLTTNQGYKGMNYQELIPVLTKAIQEQQAIIESQKNEIDQLKKKSSEIDMLKAEIDFIKAQILEKTNHVTK